MDRSFEAKWSLSREELAAATGVSLVRLTRLVRLGVIEPTTPDATEYSVPTALRLRRMLRLEAELGVNLVGAAIILDLVERLRQMERESAGS